MVLRKVIIAAFATSSLMPALTVPAHADEPAAPARVCMARMSTGNPGGDSETMIIVDAPQAAWLADRGYAIQSCGGFSDSVSEGMVSICQISRSQDKDAKDRFFSVYAVTPAEMCELGERM